MRGSSILRALGSRLTPPVPPVRMVNRNREHLYKIQFHQVKPEHAGVYRDLCKEHLVKLDKNPDIPIELMGSFSTWYGKQDQHIHVWRYNDNGYQSHHNSELLLQQSKEYTDFRQERSKLLNDRKNELVYEFGFWPAMVAKDRDAIYELRSYQLKPGTIADWAGEWNNVFSKKYRVDEPVGGFFSDIGTLNMVYYFWAYKDLQDRLNVRNKVWGQSGEDWQRVVTNTQRLCSHMESSILEPLDFSPTQ